MSSLLYQVHRPTQVRHIGAVRNVQPVVAVERNLTARILQGFDITAGGDIIESRHPLLINKDIHVGLAAPTTSLRNYFYKNADCDEMIFIHKGSGKLRTFLGNIPFENGDYLIIPRGMIYQMDFDTTDNRVLYAESYHPIYTPKRYRNWFGQLLEHSPYCERDFKVPQELETYDEKGDFPIHIKKQGHIHELIYATHPFDVVGWDGYNFPYGFSIHNFEPITGRVHQPPPVHQTFERKLLSYAPLCLAYMIIILCPYRRHIITAILILMKCSIM